MGTDRKRMKKVRKKRIEADEKQIAEHKDKIEHEKGRKDTTKDYWRKEIEEYSKRKEEEEAYLEEND